MQQNLANSSATCAAWVMDGKNGSARELASSWNRQDLRYSLGKGSHGGGELLVAVAINSSYNSYMYQAINLPCTLSGHLARQVRDKLRMLSSTERGSTVSR